MKIFTNKTNGSEIAQQPATEMASFPILALLHREAQQASTPVVLPPRRRADNAKPEGKPAAPRYSYD